MHHADISIDAALHTYPVQSVDRGIYFIHSVSPGNYPQQIDLVYRAELQSLRIGCDLTDTLFYCLPNAQVLSTASPKNV